MKWVWVIETDSNLRMNGISHTLTAKPRNRLRHSIVAFHVSRVNLRPTASLV